MKKRSWAILWAVLYVLCAALSVVSDLGTAEKVLSVVAGIAFFVPGAALLWLGVKEKNRALVRTVRYISLASLVLSTLTLVGVILSVNSSQTAGNVLQGVLVLVAEPMLCFDGPAASLFLWACLLTGSFVGKKGK